MANSIQRSRFIAYQKQAGLCFYCGLRMWLDAPRGPRPLRCTAEHLIARCDGGSDAPSNIVAACWHCNRTRHKRKHPPAPTLYRDEVRRRLQCGRWLPAQVVTWGSGQSTQGFIAFK